MKIGGDYTGRDKRVSTNDSKVMAIMAVVLLGICSAAIWGVYYASSSIPGEPDPVPPEIEVPEVPE